MLNMLLYFTFLLIKASLHGPQNVIHVYIFIKEAISVGGGGTVEEHTYISWWIYRYILYEPLMICFFFLSYFTLEQRIMKKASILKI
jgi:uncharacterized BrkB/YihY/UPF0761 family membrane protein